MTEIKNIRELLILIFTCMILMSICFQSGCSPKEDRPLLIHNENDIMLRESKAQVLEPLADNPNVRGVKL